MKNKKYSSFESIISMRVLISMILYTIVMSLPSFGQRPEWGEGDIPSIGIEIIDKRELTLPPANRNFEKIPPRPSEPIKPPIRYDFQSFNFSAPPINPQIRPLKLKAASPTQVYGGFLRLGYGNYASPLVEGYITSRKDKDKLVGAHIYHSSSGKGPVDGRNSGSGTTRASLFGRTFNENIVLSGRIDAENRSTHFYGYPEGLEVDRSDIRQSYNLFKIYGDISNAKNSEFSYKLGGLVSHLADKYNARETEANLIFNSGYKVSDDSRFNIDATYTVLSRKDAEVSARLRNLLVINPTYTFSPVEDLRINLGLSLAYENDTLDSKALHIYPIVKATYPVSPSVDLFASIDGGMEKVSLQTLSYQNIWIAPNVPLASGLSHTNKFYEFSVGINSRIGNKVGAKAGFSNSVMRNMYFFVNLPNTAESPYGQALFDVVYSTKSFYRTNVYGSLSFAQSEKVKLMVRGDVFAYGLPDSDVVQEPWHLPRYKLNASAAFNVAEKLLLNFDIIGQGGMRALDPETGNIVKLDGALDLSSKVEYLFSQSFSIFVQFNNILGTNYPLYLYYPARGFQFTAGLTWSF